jgi:hypothetical protein
VWFVLCELSFSYPSVDVYAHMCWTWMESLRCAELDDRSVTCTTFCICLGAVDVNPDG